MAIKIKFRRGTEASWTAENPLLDAGELGFETDTSKFKIGDGSTIWTELPYLPSSETITFTPAEGSSLTSDNVSAAVNELEGFLLNLQTEKIGTTDEFSGQVTGTYDALIVGDEHGTDGILFHHDQMHAHDGSDDSGQVDHTSLTSADADTSETDVHHTLGTQAFQAAAGNHRHVSYSTADISRINTTTFGTNTTPLTNFNLNVPGSAVATMVYRLPVIANAGGFKVNWQTPTGGTMYWSAADGPGTTGISSSVSGTTLNAGGTIALGTSTLPQFVQIRGYYVGGTNAGTVVFHFAGTATTGTAIIKKGAYMEYNIQ